MCCASPPYLVMSEIYWLNVQWNFTKSLSGDLRYLARLWPISSSDLVQFQQRLRRFSGSTGGVSLIRREDLSPSKR